MTAKTIQKRATAESRRVDRVGTGSPKQLHQLDADQLIAADSLETGVGCGEVDIARFGDMIVSGAAIQRVVAEAATDGVETGALSANQVVAIASGQAVRAAAAVESIVAVTTVERVVASAAVERVGQ